MKCICNKCMVLLLIMAVAPVWAADDAGQLRSSSSSSCALISLLQATEEDQKESISSPRAQRSKRERVNGPYRCDTCDVEFKAKELLRRHFARDAHKKSLGTALTEGERDNMIKEQLEGLRIKRPCTQWRCDICASSFLDMSVLQAHMNTDKHRAQVIKGLYTTGQYHEVLTQGRELLTVLSPHTSRQVGLLIQKCELLLAPQPIASSSSSSSSFIDSDVQAVVNLHCDVCDLSLVNNQAARRHEGTRRHKDHVAFLALLAQPVTIPQ